MSVRRLLVRNYRGVECLEYEFPPNGALIKGRNGAGKTSILRAIESALLARDVAPEAIRKGADKAEILVDLDNHSVKRTITPKGNTLTVLREGMKAPKPQTYLTELLGTSSLDPMDLLLLKGKARKAKVLEALPVTVTVEQLRQWVPRIPDTFDTSGHGLEVLERVHAKVYEQRTKANAEAKIARQDADKAQAELVKAWENPPPGLIDLAPLEQAAKEANARLVALRAREEEHKRASNRTASAREKIEALRAQAKKARELGSFIPQHELEAVDQKIDMLDCRVAELKAALAEAQQMLASAVEELTKMSDHNSAVLQNQKLANDLDEQAETLEHAIAQAVVEPVSEEDIARALVADSDAARQLKTARLDAEAWHVYAAAKNKAMTLGDSAYAIEAEARRLDGIVKALTNEAPAALLAQCDGIPGLSLRDDDILLDGVSLDSLCGAEQVRFCVEVARRANAKSKVLIVDGLERLDPDSLDVFVHEATRDGWQLLASRVDRGEVVIEAIESSIDQAAE